MLANHFIYVKSYLFGLHNCFLRICHGITVRSFSMCWTKTQIAPEEIVRSPCIGGYAVGTCAGLRGGWTAWVDRFKSAPHQSSSLAIVVRVQLGVQVFFLSEGTSAGSFWNIVNMEEVGEGGENSIWKNRPLAMEVDLFMFDIAHTMYKYIYIYVLYT